MASFNKVILMGNLTADPELKQTQSGISACTISIAVNRRRSKEDNNDVDFFNVQTWRQTAEFVSRYFKKGKPILVCGQLQTRSWTDNNGNKRTATEVVADEVSFVGGAESSTEAQRAPAEQIEANASPSYTPAAYGGNAQFEELNSDEPLPF